MNTFAEYEFRVRGYECGPDGRATLPSICNYLQEAAGLHASVLGFSRDDFLARGEDTSWILTRIRVNALRYPKGGERVVVGTFPHAGRRVTVNRDYILRVGDETICRATSEWAVVNLATRKIAPIPEFVVKLSNDERPPVFGASAYTRLRWDCLETAGEKALLARRSDIDWNGHVNNVHYIEWLVETLPDAAFPIGDFEIVFRAETMAGEEVRAASVETEPGVWLARAAGPDGTNHVIARIVRR